MRLRALEESCSVFIFKTTAYICPLRFYCRTILRKLLSIMPAGYIKYFHKEGCWETPSDPMYEEEPREPSLLFKVWTLLAWTRR